jgi:outer membrane immunogenic protein
MRGTFIVAITLTMLVAGELASAADMGVPASVPVRTLSYPSPLVYDWTGFYLGLNGGGAWGKSNQTQVFPPSLSAGTFDTSGGLVGGTIGFNLQVDHFVFGTEGDLDWASVSGSANCPTAGLTCSTRSNYLVTERGRFGYALDWWLPYVTGGAAMAQVKQSFSPAIGINDGVGTNRVGWTVGGGLEYAIGNSGWAAKVEYLHVDLGTFYCNIACAGVAGQTIGTRFNEEIFRAGINFRLK